MNTDSFDSGAWEYYLDGVAPKHPTVLALTTLEYAAEFYWTNNQVVNESVTISGTDTAWYTDAYVVETANNPNPNGNSPYCIGFCKLTQHMARYQNAQPWTLEVDMAAVIPVPTESLTFSPNPAVAGQNVTGTLTLAAPTPIPAEILVSSLTSGVTVEHDSYILPTNDDTLTFNVSTGPEGCEPYSATIQVFYADRQNAVLTVNPKSNCK